MRRLQFLLVGFLHLPQFDLVVELALGQLHVLPAKLLVQLLGLCNLASELLDLEGAQDHEVAQILALEQRIVELDLVATQASPVDELAETRRHKQVIHVVRVLAHDRELVAVAQ